MGIGRIYHNRWVFWALWGLMAGLVVVIGQGAAGAAAEADRERKRSPVDFFRDLLEMSPAERASALSEKSAEQREVIGRKLREYRQLPASERELRLRLAELHWYLRPLLDLPPEERPQQLSKIPENERGVVAERLEHWERLPGAVQEKVLGNRKAMGYFLRRGLPVPHPEAPESTEVREGAGESLGHDRDGGIDWQGWSDESLDQMASYLQQFFELSEKERERTLSLLSEARRRETEDRLKAFEDLPSDQRRQCIRSLLKFAQMDRSQQERFLTNVRRWRAMPPEEREAWRGLVRRLPPLPRGMEKDSSPVRAPEPPPMPGSPSGRGE